MEIIYALSGVVYLLIMLAILAAILIRWGLLGITFLCYGVAIASTGMAILFFLMAFPTLINFMIADESFLQLGKEVSVSVGFTVVAIIFWRLVPYFETKLKTQNEKRRILDEEYEERRRLEKANKQKEDQDFKNGIIDGTVTSKRWND